ncbi:MAG: UDP-N-acetylmuramate dehydrogenase [Dehalococcoidia bacterium]
MNDQFLAELRRAAAVRLAEPMSQHTTFGIGGPADVYAVAESEEQLRALMDVARCRAVPFFILGSGSNILVGDKGIRGLVIENRSTSIDEPIPQDNGSLLVRAQSGASLAGLARRLALAGLGGLEWACGIPGSLGGAVVYNAGAYGGCLADCLRSVRVANSGAEVTELAASDLALSYRSSAFTRGLIAGKVVLSIDLILHQDNPQALAARLADLDARRQAAQPRERNAGSIFKNTPEHPAWWLIDQVNLRGHRIGDAQISPKHTNFIVNLGHARARDVKALMDLAQKRVEERFGLRLEPELTLVGEGFDG